MILLFISIRSMSLYGGVPYIEKKWLQLHVSQIKIHVK